MNDLAVDFGDKVLIMSNDVEFTIPKEDYDFLKERFIKGFTEEDTGNIIQPCDIIGYLMEYNPEAEKNIAESEVAIAKMGMNKEQMQMISIGVIIFLALIGLGALYILVNQNSAGADTVVQSAASGISIT